MTRKLMLFVVLAMLPVIGSASNITLQGNFTADDNLQLFSMSIATPGTVDIRSYGYAGGTTSTGTVVPSGGFDTILTLFNASGAFLNENDDGAGVATDPTTGLAGDARITQNLTAGSYLVALTEYDNFSQGNLADGFTEMGNPNFTASANFATGGACPGNLFRDISGTAGRCRNGNWTVDFTNVASVTPAAPVPEPSALLLAGVGLALLLATRCRSRNKMAVLALVFVAALATLPLRAQSTPPDYSNVSDFLNGQRSLLQIQDLQIMTQDSAASYDATGIWTITTANSVQSTGPYSNPAGTVDFSGKPFVSFSAHMFNQPQAVTLSTLPNFNQSGRLAILVQNVQPAVNPSHSGGPWPGLGDDPEVSGGAVADFTLDGFDDLALSFADGRMLVLTPNNVNDFGANPRTNVSRTDPLVSVVAGDFNGDGKQELAGLHVTPNGGLKLETFTVDPNSLAVALATSVTLAPDNPIVPIGYFSLARGRFNASGHDQLVVAFAGFNVPSTVEVIDFLVDSLNPVIGPPASPAGNVAFNSGFLEVKTGKFGLPSNSFDQVVYHSSNGNQNGRFFEILTVNPISFNLGPTGVVQYSNPDTPCAVGIQVGNFDHQTSNGQPDLNSQIAFMYCRPAPDYGQYGYTMNIYSVDAATLNINGNPNSQYNFNDVALNTVYNQQVVFLPTDLQGRSLTLGEPTRILIKNTSQPSVIVGVPPMHLDYVSPTPSAPAELLNLSFMWDGFFTTYDQQQSSSLKTSATNTTSWSFGLKQQGTTSLTIGDPDVEGLKATNTFTAAEDLKGSSSNTHGTYTSSDYKLSNTTGIDDSVTYVNSDFYIWVYPVIGKTVCPSSKPSCQPNEQIPLTLQYSAVNGNASVTTGVDGGALTWFQPPWEPGNILSYPGNLAQLQLIYPTLNLLSNPGPTFDTSTSATTEQATFNIKTTDTPVTSFDQNYSFDNNFSVNGQVGFDGVSVGGGYDLDVNGSAALSYLSKNTTTLAESAGLITSKSGKFRTPDLYKYAMTPNIMGFQQPGGVVDNQPLSGDVKTFGFLSALYTVSPDVTSPESWWKLTYSKAPDIALNHPQRWSEAYGVTQPLDAACLDPGGSYSQADCPALNPSTPNTPSTDLFHYMRGFFITNPNSPGQGPQLEDIVEGEKLNLQARVYNYSLVPMQNANAYAAFYVAPADLDGAPGQAMLVNTVQLPPIPQFDPSSTTTLNWLLTPSVIFDSGDPKYASLLQQGSNNVMFYVVVWMEDTTGSLIPEMPVHGFTSKPSSSACTPNTLDQCTPTLSQWFQKEQSFSNNIGLFPQAIAIRSQSLGAVSGSLPPEASVEIGKVDVSENRVKVSDIVFLSATLSPSGETSGVNVNFYDGDPQDGGKMFKETRVPYIAGNEQRLVRAMYRPSTCGTHELFVVVNKEKKSEIVRRAPPLRVACKAGQ